MTLHGLRDVKEFGAVADGRADDTKAVQKAIDVCSGERSELRLSPGTYSCGMLRLRSDLALTIAAGAILAGRPDPATYPYIDPLEPKALGGRTWRAFLYAERADNITIAGPGRISPGGGAGVFRNGKGNSPERPYGLYFVRCRNVTVRDVTMRNSAFWMQRYVGCEDLFLRGLHVYNHCNLNNDGVDIDGCKRVVLSDCVIDSSDDALCLKSGGTQPLEDLVASNCILSSHASAIKFGTASVGGFRRVTISNCVIKPSRADHVEHPFKLQKGLAGIDLGSVDGGVLEDVNISDILIDGVLTPIFMRLGTRSKRPEGASPGDGTLRRVCLRGIRARDAGPIACSITGVPGRLVEDVTLQDISVRLGRPGTQPYWTPEDPWPGAGIEEVCSPERLLSLDVPEREESYPVCRMFERNLPAYGFYVRHARGITFDNVELRTCEDELRPAFCLDDVHEISLSGIDTDRCEGQPDIRAARSGGIKADSDLRLEEAG